MSGLICLLGAGEARFDDDDLQLLQILSDQAAVAIENARLLSGRDELVHELAGLLDISEAAGTASDERELATLLADADAPRDRRSTARGSAAGTRARPSCACWAATALDGTRQK